MKAIVLSDNHIPFHDKKLTSAILKLIKQHKPKYIILNGDIVDFYSLSKFDKSPDRAEELQFELNILVDFLKSLREASRNSELIYILGNHENRLVRYLSSQRAIANLDCLKFRNLIQAKKIGIRICKHKFKLNDLIITHGHRYGTNAARTTLIQDYAGHNVICGHSHKIDYSCLPNVMGDKFECHISGHLSDKSQLEYAKNLSWTQSFIIIDDKVNPIDCENGRFSYQGVNYES